MRQHLPTDADLVTAALAAVRASALDSDEGLMDVVSASYAWIIARVAARDRQLAERIRQLLDFVWMSYVFKVADAGPQAARAWAMGAFRRRLRVPRPESAGENDRRIVEIADRLRRDLAPVFEKPWNSIAARDSKARPIVESVLKRHVKTLPHHVKLDRFITALLEEVGINKIRLSRARRRERERRAHMIKWLLALCRIVLAGPDPDVAARGWTRADIESKKASLEQELDGLRIGRRLVHAQGPVPGGKARTD